MRWFFFDRFITGKETGRHWNTTDFQRSLLFQKMTSEITFFHPEYLSAEIFYNLPEEEKEKARNIYKEFMGRTMHITEDRIHPDFLERLRIAG